ncbi:MAG: DHA2 family efflux MFS transporter permease subunit [Desulfovibrio sp.]|nr:MAG: DHA2 family efflux MFS transporter permease subunit [Desulfovibrio sp.]
MSSSTPPATGPGLPKSQKIWTVFAVNLSILMATLDMSIVNVSLPTLVSDLDTDFATIQWVVLSYILVITCMILSVARLGDMLGKKKLYMWGVLGFSLGSLACGLSPTVECLIAARALQGVGAVFTQALGAAIIAESVPRHELGRAMGVVGSTVSLGLAAGPSLGGLIIGAFGWPWLFLINVPLGALTLFIAWRVIPELPPHKTGQRFDVPGGIILFVTLGCYALAMTWGQNAGFGQTWVLTLLATSGVGLVAFLITEFRVSQPMIDPKLFRGSLIGLNLLMGVLVFIGLAGYFVVPFYLELAQGYAVEEMGLLMMVVPLCMGILSPPAGILADRFGSRWVSLLGILVMLCGALAMSTLKPDTPWWGFVLRVAPYGLGLGLFQAPNNTAIMGQAPPERRGVVSGLLSYSRTFGQSTGLPLVGAIYTAYVLASLAGTGVDASGTDFTQATPQALTHALNNAYLIMSAFLLLPLGLAVLCLVLDPKGTKGRSPGPARGSVPATAHKQDAS